MLYPVSIQPVWWLLQLQNLAESNIDVAKETAALLLGLGDPDDLEDYDYGEYDAHDEEKWHLTELTMPELIDLEDPYERCYEEDEDPEEGETEDSEDGENQEVGEEE